jgi:hypothetical protein
MVGALRGRLQGSQRRATVPLACEGSFASASVWRIVGVCRIPPKAAKSSQTSGLGYRSNEPIAQKPRRPRSAKRCEGLRCRRRSQPYHMILRHINRARTRRASRKSESDSGGGGQKKAQHGLWRGSRPHGSLDFGAAGATLLGGDVFRGTVPIRSHRRPNSDTDICEIKGVGVRSSPHPFLSPAWPKTGGAFS